MTTNITPTVSPVQQIESLYARLEKAREIAAAGKVHPIVGLENHYAVECSRIDSGMYLVNGTCTCIDAQQRIDLHHGWCKHKLAVELYKDTLKAETPKASKKASRNGSSPQDKDELEQKVNDLYR
jgi:hypothetical protein